MTQWLNLVKSGIDLALLASRVFGSKRTALNFINRTRKALEKTDGNTKEIERLLSDLFNDRA